MSKASVNLTCLKCGNAFTARKDCYNSTDAANWEKYMAQIGGICKECYKKEKDEEREQEILKKREKLKKAVEGCPVIFPVLEGTEKQVAWANDLRNDIVSQMMEAAAMWEKVDQLCATDPKFKDNWDKLFNKSAKWWIDNRGTKIFRYIIGDRM